MEGIIILLGSLMGGIFLVVVPVFTAVLALIADLIAGLITLLIPNFRRPSSGESEPSVSQPGNITAAFPWMKWIRRIAWFSGGIVMFYIVVVSILQLFFFKPAASALLHRMGEKAGIGLAFTEVRGNLFTGRFAIDGLELESRAGTDRNAWKADVGTAAIDIDLLRVFGERSWLDSLVVKDVTAEVTAGPAPAFDPLAALKRIRDRPEPKRYREKRRFGIRETQLENLQLTWNRPGSSQTLAIEHFACENLKSEYAVFQVFFRSNARGQLNDTPWKIVTEKTGELARQTEWRFEDVPLGLAADTVGGPFKLFENGTLDVFVTDEWSLDDGVDIDLDWQFLFHGFEAKPPASLADSPLAITAVEFINQASDPLDIHFTLVLDEDEMKGRASLDTRVLADALTKALIPNQADAVKDKAKDLWNKFRRMKEEE